MDSLKVYDASEIMEVIYRLISDYYKYGFLYGSDGMVMKRFIFLYSDPMEEDGQGRLYDAEGVKLIGNRFSLNGGLDILMNPYLDVHNASVFKQMDRKKMHELTSEEIIRDYLEEDIKKLLAMLRYGYHYASEKSISREVPDAYLTAGIVMVWKLLVIDTINSYDIKEKYFVKHHDYYSQRTERYSWDEREYAKRLSGTYTVREGKTNFSFLFSKEEQERIKKQNEQLKKEENQLIQVINNSISDKKWNELCSSKVYNKLGLTSPPDIEDKKVEPQSVEKIVKNIRLQMIKH